MYIDMWYILSNTDDGFNYKIIKLYIAPFLRIILSDKLRLSRRVYGFYTRKVPSNWPISRWNRESTLMRFDLWRNL